MNLTRAEVAIADMAGESLSDGALQELQDAELILVGGGIADPILA